MEDASPTRWHLAHTTWFFETFLLRDQPGYEVFDSSFNFLFNSYYNTIGKQFPRNQRGLISRPSLAQIKAYRVHVDQQILELLSGSESTEAKAGLLQIGLHHEQQHQELILTDIKHVLSCNPIWPAYSETDMAESLLGEDDWISLAAGNYEVGHDGDCFAFDNESPRHTVYLHDCQVSTNLVTCGEFLEFIDHGGYDRPEHWLSLGWNAVNHHDWKAPLYWRQDGNRWMQFTLAGMVQIDPNQPVTHLSLFEADAYARWRGMRLPTEFEWEIACQQSIVNKRTTLHSFADELVAADRAIHPTQPGLVDAESTECGFACGLMGSVWQWTNSSYAPYPGYSTPDGAVGEYNGKFMCNQYVLRGGSVATSRSHIRPTYRNFFPADTRWQFSGVRLARN